jgi:hypothetical protein
MAPFPGRLRRYNGCVTSLPQHEPTSFRDLRASFLGHPAAAPGARPADPGSLDTVAPEDTTPPPSPDELLAASPALVRLCESYHRTHAQMTTRSRRQRLGIFLLVSGISVGALFLSRSGTLTATLVSDLVLAVAGASCASLGLLSLLWLRDERRLRGVQGDRLLRALHSNCSLPVERVSAFRRKSDPVSAFFDCYESWRATSRPGGAAGILAALRGHGA